MARGEDAGLLEGNGRADASVFADDTEAAFSWAIVVRAAIEQHAASALGAILFWEHGKPFSDFLPETQALVSAPRAMTTPPCAPESAAITYRLMQQWAYPRKVPFVFTWAVACAIGITLVDTLWNWSKSGHLASISDIVIRFLLYGCGGMITGFWVWKWHERAGSAAAQRMPGVSTTNRSEQQKDRT